MRKKKLEQEAIAKMREMRAMGMKVKAIAAEIGCSEALVSLRTKNMPGIRRWAKEPADNKRWKDGELWARWREIQASAQDILFARQWGNQWEKGMRPCEHCRWHMNGDPVIVCLRYCDLWGMQWPHKKKAPAHGANMDRRTAPNEAASPLPLSIPESEAKCNG